MCFVAGVVVAGCASKEDLPSGAGGSSVGAGGGSGNGGRSSASGGAGAGGVSPGTGGAGGSGGTGGTPADAAGERAGGEATGGAPASGSVDAAAPTSVPAGLLPAGAACPPGPFNGAPVGPNPSVTMVKGGYTVTEGPAWLAAQQALYFTEFEGQNGRIHKYTPGNKAFTVLADRVGVNGLAVDPHGQLIAASQDMRRLTRFDPLSGQRTPVPGSDSFMARPFNAVNDVVVRGDGNMYFTDPTFINEGRPGQGVTAYYRLSPAGEVTRIGTGPQPNSPGISPDGKWLYVTSSGESNAKLWRHPLNADGSVGERTDFLSVRSESLAIDCAGNLFLSAAGKIMVYSPEGMLLSTFASIPAGITNLAIGGPGAKMLYITARAALYETPLEIPGLPN